MASPIRETVEFVLSDAKYAIMRSEPQLSVVIIENLADDIVGQTIFRGAGCNSAMAPAAQATVHRANPKPAVSFGEETTDIPLGEPPADEPIDEPTDEPTAEPAPEPVAEPAPAPEPPTAPAMAASSRIVVNECPFCHTLHWGPCSV